MDENVKNKNEEINEQELSESEISADETAENSCEGDRTSECNDECCKESHEKKREHLSEKERALVEENEKLIKELDKAKAEAGEYKDKWVRNVAEFDNYKKRNASLWTDAYNDGTKDAVIKILPVGDNLDFALSMDLDEKTKEGIVNIRRKFCDTLKTMEIEEINPIGEKFNPEIAEAVMQVEAEDGEESEIVKAVFLKGYRLKGKIIRYAKVSVTK